MQDEIDRMSMNPRPCSLTCGTECGKWAMPGSISKQKLQYSRTYIHRISDTGETLSDVPMTSKRSTLSRSSNSA